MPGYETPNPFYDLYFDFTGYSRENFPENRTAIAQDLASALSEQTSNEGSKGTLCIANSVGLYVYSSEPGHALICSADFRAAPNSGFYELTSLSHVGPAIAYLGALKELNNTDWEKHIDPMLNHIESVREVNSKKISEHWLTELDCEAWRGKEIQIKNMIDYGCSLIGNYLNQVNSSRDQFSNEHAIANFLEVNTSKYPIPFNNIMIGTFSLVGLKGIFDIYQVLSQNDIDWPNAKIILHNLAGTNYAAGTTESSNWLFHALTSISNLPVEEKRILILPYADIPEGVGSDYLGDDEYTQLSVNQWGAIHARPLITNMAFGHVKDIVIPPRSPIPGDYQITTADDIEHFSMRLKLSVGNPKEMLSNTVGFWLVDEFKEKKWQVENVDIPGLTHGFPQGINCYPDNAPAIQK
tara:strand:- start:8079 stop:9308 length:1230 start_codon:yes stop_codon:yes gene_type:complete